MKNYRKVAVLQGVIVSLLLFAGCEKWLNIAPKGMLVPETVDEFDLMLNANDLCKSSLYEALFLTDDTYLLVTTDDNGLDVPTNLGTSTGRMYVYDADRYYTETDYNSYYDAAYKRIYTYNVIVENVLKASGDAQKARSVRAEALCGRAMEYLLLINLFAPHYDASTASSSYGVPLILSPDLEKEGVTKASVAEVYAQVEKDLHEALADLPSSPTHGTPLRFSKAASLAFLAKVAFLKGEWTSALTWCQRVKDEMKGLPLHDWTKNQLVDPMSMLSDYPDVVNSEENILLRYPDAAFGLSWCTYCPPSLLKLFDQENDMRYVLQFTDNVYGEPLSSPDLRYYSSYIKFSTGISTPEIYLMAAECKVRMGDVAEGIDLLNQLRARRIKDVTPLAAGTAEEALRLVLEERRRELFNHSVERLIDIKRLAKDHATRVTVRHELPDGVTIEVDGNDSRMILPIPPQVLNFNPGMKPRG